MEKVAILTCLMDQLLTYADIRDTIEDRIEKNRQLKLELKNAQISERKRENEYSAAKWHMKREAKINKRDPQQTATALEELHAAEEKRKLQSERQIDTYKKSAYDKDMYLGMDRAYRKYYKLESIPGLFIESPEDFPGTCLSEPVKHVQELVGADKTAIAKYLRKCWNKNNSSDKENSPTKNSLKKMNGDVVSEGDMIETSAKLLMCSGNEKTCVVHSTNQDGTKWRFVPHVDLFESVVKTLNKRGFRESELMQTLQNDKETLTKFIKQTPVQHLNPELDILQEEDARARVATRGKKSYMDANFGFPSGTTIDEILQGTLTDDILELEEKIYSGSLGQLHIKDRETWRDCLLNKKYKSFNREIVRRTYDKSEEMMEVDEEEEEASTEIKSRYGRYDPGTFLGHSKLNHSCDSDKEDESNNLQDDNIKLAVECLGIALAQVAHAIEPKFLQKPMGDFSNRRLVSCNPSSNRLDSWEQSLLNSTSFSQIFLHYSTLDSCVMWNRSTLRAKCRVCRGQKDSENMLLCDSCNLGHHLYCLKPKLTSIPKEDWFCDRCTAIKEKEMRKAGSEIIPKKKRRIFKEEDQEEEEIVKEESDHEEEDDEDEQEDDNEEEEESEEEQKDSEESGEDEEEEEESSDVGENSIMNNELCATCNSGGILITCDNCSSAYHKECVYPPLRRVKANWTCNECNGTTKEDKILVELKNNNNRGSKSRRSDRGSKKHEEVAAASSDSDDYPLSHHAAGNINNERRSAAKARHNIYNFVKSLRRLSSSDNGSDSEESSNHNHSQRKRSYRRESGRDDLPLHNAALQDLLTEVMKFPDAWPFLRPVQKNEVPDYHEVISHPMDFGTIKYKLNMGKYSTDSQLMCDVALVFQNCNTYNEIDSEIYRCGQSVLDFFRSKCADLGLKIYNKNSEEEKETDKKRRKK